MLAGSLSLLAEPIGTGRGGNNPPIVNVCAPTVEAIWITEDQASHQFTVEVTLSSGAWGQFPLSRWDRGRYTFIGSGWRYVGSSAPSWGSFESVGSSLLRAIFRGKWVVQFDLPSSSSSDYSFEIQPSGSSGTDGFAYFRGKFYNWYDHWIHIYLNLSDLHPITGGPLRGVTPYRGHAWIMPHGPSESGGYYVPVYFRRSSSSEWEMLGNF